MTRLTIIDSQMAQIKEIQDSLNLPKQSDVMQILLQSYFQNQNESHLDLSDSESEIVAKACEIESYKDLLKSGLIWACKKAVTQNQILQNFNPENRNSTVKGSAKQRILKAIRELIHHNDSVEDSSERWCITKSSVFKACGANRQTIADLFDNDSEIINLVQNHNEKYGLTENSNRKGKGVNFPVKI